MTTDTSIRTDSTSIGSLIRSVPSIQVFAIGAFLISGAGHTNASETSAIRTIMSERTASRPTGRIEPIEAGLLGEAILEIRRRSGLTWEELGDLFSVSRRSVHHWANGKAVSAEHDRMIRQVLAVIRVVDRGPASATRAALLHVDGSNRAIFDTLREGLFDDAMAQASGLPKNIQRMRSRPLSQAADEARRPLSPATLLEGTAAPFGPEHTGRRAARVVRVSKVTG